MPDDDNNCPSCAGSAGSVYGPLANQPNVVVQPYVPPTEAEFEFSRRFYADLKTRNGRDPAAGIPVQAQAREHEPTLTAEMLRRLNAGEAVLMPDTSGLIVDPQGPAARSRHPAVFDAPPTFEGAPSALLHRATNGEDVLMPSQLTAPWFEPQVFQFQAEGGAQLPPIPIPPPLGPLHDPRGWADFLRRLADWLQRVARLTRFATAAKAWEAFRLKAKSRPADHSDYTDPPSEYVAEDCPTTFHNKAHIHGGYSIEHARFRFEWTQRMADNWKERGDPFVDATPPLTDAELEAKYGDKDTYKPTSNGVAKATEGFLARMQQIAKELQAAGVLPGVPETESHFQDIAEREAGFCPPNCPKREVTVTGLDLDVIFDVDIRMIFELKQNGKDQWFVDVYALVTVSYDGTIYFTVTCSD